MKRYSFIEAEEVPVRRASALLQVSPAAYYEWHKHVPSEHEVKDAELTRSIEKVHAASRGTYGSPRVHHQLREGGISSKVFAGIMLGLGFHLLNRLFGHVGQLAAWPPVLAAFVPTVSFLAMAILMIWRLERR